MITSVLGSGVVGWVAVGKGVAVVISGCKVGSTDAGCAVSSTGLLNLPDGWKGVGVTVESAGALTK